MLTVREEQIIKYLFDAESFIKIKELARWLGVTERTIKYDLDQIREWMLTHEIPLHSKPNIGLWIEMESPQKREVRQLLLSNKRTYPNKDDRIKAIIKRLFLTEGYLTAIQMSDFLKVSRNTILNDLHAVEAFIIPWQVQLKRQPRMGYRLKGEELHKRILLENLIHRQLTPYEIYQITMQLSGSEVDNPFLIDDPLKEVYMLVFGYVQMFYKNKRKGNHLLSLLFRLTISIYRLGTKHTLDCDRVLDDTLSRSQDEKMVLGIMRKLYGDLNSPLFEDEFYYILRGTQKNSNEVDVAQLTAEIIRNVSQYEGINYKNDPKLYSNLLAHLSLRFQNEALNLTEYNPLMDEIKQTHPTLFESTKRAFETHIGYTGDADSFVSYLTLHFLVADEHQMRKKVNVLYVCATGKGVARLVKNRVEANIPYAQLVAYCSVTEVELFCHEHPVDLIISVFPIETKLPVVIVDGLPKLKDIEKIETCVEKIMDNKPALINDYLDLKPSKDNVGVSSAEISLKIILKGFEISSEIIQLFEDCLVMDKIKALNMHMFLMIHRYYFDAQYDHYAFNETVNPQKVERYFTDLSTFLTHHELNVHQAEINALLQYFK